MTANGVDQMATFGAQREAFLAQRILARDGRAFEEFYEGYRPRLSRFVVQLVKRPLLVEEVVNDTMMVVWNSLERFKGDSKLSTWIFAIAYRKGMRALTRNDDPRESVDDGIACDTPSPEQNAAATQLHVALASAMGRLSPDHRTVLDLSYFHELGTRDIASIMDCPVDTVKTRLFHARKNLRNLLSGNGADWL